MPQVFIILCCFMVNSGVFLHNRVATLMNTNTVRRTSTKLLNYLYLKETGYRQNHIILLCVIFWLTVQTKAKQQLQGSVMLWKSLFSRDVLF